MISLFVGSEYDVIPDLLRDSKFCQILIEIHGNRRSAGSEVEFVKLFSKHDYYLFSYEINGFFLPLCEFSFIHKDCMARYGINIILGRIF